jgi:hypothetical protein
MASSGLTRMSKRVLDRLETTTMRSKVQDYEGQIFVWDRASFEKAMSAEMPAEMSAKMSAKNVKKLSEAWSIPLAKQDARQMSIKAFRNRLLSAKQYVIKTKAEKYSPSTHEIYAVFNYASVQRIKRDVGVLFETLTGKDPKVVTGRIDKGDTVKEAIGSHIGHGEFGSAVSTTKVFAAESVMQTKTSKAKYSSAQAYKNISQHIVEYKRSMKVSLSTDHYQEVSARGSLIKNYTPILSEQGTGANMADSVDEGEALRVLTNAVREEYLFLLNQEGSDTLLDAIEATTLHSLTKPKKIKYKGSAKPRAVVKSKGTSKAVKGKINTQERVTISSGVGAVRQKTARKGRAGKAASTGFSQVQLYAALNSRINAAVAKNMDLPGLQYQTGRFASGVKITDVSKTPQGFASIGYTYQLYPYQTFEPGFAQGSTDRDPRKLIDRSIREIAAQMVTGRLYTRRQ